jgi:hypothetical protein
MKQEDIVAGRLKNDTDEYCMNVGLVMVLASHAPEKIGVIGLNKAPDGDYWLEYSFNKETFSCGVRLEKGK